MKKTHRLLAILFLAFIFTGASAQTYNIRVVNARNFKAPAINWNNPDDVSTYYVDLARHKDREVNVYQYASYYRVSYFRQEGDSIRVHGFDMTEPGPSFDKVAYTWNNDTLNLNLFSSASDAKSKTYKGFGHGRTSSLKVD